MLVSTIFNAGYRAHAHVLAQSVSHHSEHADFIGVDLDVAGAGEFGLEEEEFVRLAAMYDPAGLIGALKPRLLRYLLDGQAEEVIFLDSDIELFGGLDLAVRLVREHGVVLTPHMTTPAPQLEQWLLRGGALNAGFVAVAGDGGKRFADWWAARTARTSIHAIEDGYLYEQRWLDLTPSLFDAHVLRDPGYNVMGWNLHEREIKLGGRPAVNGVPLTFFHFCGSFDPQQPDRLGTMPGLPWPSLELHPAAAQLCRSYASKLLDAGYLETRQHPYRFGTTPDGHPIDAPMRAAYRLAVLEAEAAGRELPPNPLCEGEGFIQWLLEPLDEPGITRYLAALRANRADLRYAFPEVPGPDSRRYLDWVRGEPANRRTIPPRLMPV